MFILYRIAEEAEHPALSMSPRQPIMPSQTADMSLNNYHQQWIFYLHACYLNGIFLSD